MKKGIRFIFLISILLVFSMIFRCENKEDNLSIVKGTNYDKVIEQGFQSQGLSLQDILYEKTIGENKMIFFASDEALGLAYMGKDEDDWTFNRITSLTDFESESKTPTYMGGGIEVETPDGIKYFLAMGKIFNPNITKITLSNDLISTIVKEKDGNIFWFKLLDNKDLFENIKVYDKDDKQLSY
jgi:hypothetical protein